MATDVSGVDAGQAVLESIRTGLYPQSEHVAAAEIPSSALPELQQQIRTARDDVEDEVRKLSRETAPDIDAWIAQAKQVQADIQRSKATAREIIQQAQTNQSLRDRASDASSKVVFLEKEVAFNSSLASVLENMRTASAALADAKEEIVQGRLQSALQKYSSADQSINNLQGVDTTRAHELLRRRSDSVKQALRDSTDDVSRELVEVDAHAHALEFRKLSAKAEGIDLELLVDLFGELDAVGPWLKSLAVKVDRTLFAPFLSDVATRAHQSLNTDDQKAWLSHSDGALSLGDVLTQLEGFTVYLSKHIPGSIQSLFSHCLFPCLMERLEDPWLTACVPIHTVDMPQFEQTLTAVGAFADHLAALGWDGESQLREWIESAPKTWLSTQREHALGRVRNLLFIGLKERQIVERVETQTVQGASIQGEEAEADDAWDDSWADANEAANGENVSSEKPAQPDEDDASAWDAEFEEDMTTTSNGVDQKVPSTNEDEEAWGWGDEEQAAAGQSGSKTNGQHKQVSTSATGPSTKAGTDRELTLRENYTVTSVPSGVLDIILQVFKDGESLSEPDLAQTSISPAVSALYNLPTLILAMYRATALTCYGRTENGNMLVYNDSLRLADQLHSLFSDKHERGSTLQLQASSQRKLESDIKALESFAKRAYGAEMDSQRTILRDLLDGAQGFSNCTALPYARECDDAMALTIDRIREVYKQWKPVLSQSALLQSVGSLLSTITSKIIVDIEDLSDIGEEESKKLRSYCNSVASLNDLFIQAHTDSQEPGDMTGLYCPNWLKFQYLGEILEGSLADIKYLWMEGELSLEFDMDEIVDLIEALFADSDYRRKAINDIRRSGRG